MVLEQGQVAEPIAGQGHRAYPQGAAGDIEGEKARIGHARDTGDEGGEGARQRQKAGKNDGLAAVRLVEDMGLQQRRLVEEARLFPAQGARPYGVAYPVVGVVAGDRGDEQCRAQHRDIHGAAGGQCAGDEQQRIARQKGRHHQTGLAEDDREQDHVDPLAVLLDQHDQMPVQMEHEIGKL